MRNISASLTKKQFYQSVELVRRGLAPVKDVTRRNGWRNLKVGERLHVCEKCQGLKKGEKPVKICVIEVVKATREPLNDIVLHADDCAREGFPKFNGRQFVEFFCMTHKNCTPETEITRIEFKYIV